MSLGFNGWSSQDLLTVGFLSFVLVFTFTFSESTSVSNFFFISNSEADVPDLFSVMCSPNMAKCESLSSSLHFWRVFLIV